MNVVLCSKDSHALEKKKALIHHKARIQNMVNGFECRSAFVD
jgi:hypothetical protein